MLEPLDGVAPLRHGAAGARVQPLRRHLPVPRHEHQQRGQHGQVAVDAQLRNGVLGLRLSRMKDVMARRLFEKKSS